MKAFASIFIVLIYFVLLALAVMRWGKSKNTSLEEFVVSGRDTPWWLMLFTVLGTWFVGSTYTAFFGWAVFEGAIVYYLGIYSIMGLVVYYFIAPKVWVWGKVHKLYNLPDYILLRYNDKGLYFIIMLAVAFLLSWPWQVLALKTFGYVVLKLSYDTIPMPVGIGIFGAVIAFYCIYGGMRSVVMTDFIQGIICTIVVLGGIYAVLQSKFGGIGPMYQQVFEFNPDLLKISAPNYFIGISIASALGAYCWPEIFNRIFLSRSAKDVKVVAKFAPVICILLVALVVSMAIGGALLPSITADLASAESGFLIMFEEFGGPIMLAFAAIVIIAAEMSSVDSQLTVMGTIFAKNIVGTLKKDGLSDKKTVSVSRWFILIYMALIWYLSIGDTGALYKYAVISYEFLATLFPAIIIGILWRRGNAMASWVSIIGGWAVCSILQLWPELQGSFGGFGAGFTGAVTAIIIYFIVGFVSAEDTRISDLFEEVDAFKES
ncbi:MAG: sodium:solute symporter family protein [Desulfobacterales bacterium]|nr:sodium:solute symporter family protein [Desulfobacterales bacterium]